MKKNLLIMMMMVLCAGFVSAQTINTVRGFVPGGSTGAGNNATYVVIGQPFSMMSVANADAQAEVMVGLAQMQLITDTTMTVVGYKDGYHEHGLDLNAQELLEALDDLSTCSNEQVEGYMGFLNFQKPNLAHNNDNFEYYYDSLFVVKVFICPDSTTDAAGNKYEVIALNEKCWINSNLRTTVACGGGSVEGMIYNSELNEVTEDMLPTYGMLYTFAAATGATTNADGILVGAQCDEETGYLQGICPCNWHLPTAEEMAPLFVLPAENLRVNGNWIVEGNNNLTGFSAEPAGFYNATFDRFEGLLTETDYWMVNCDSLENPVQDVFQLIYSCNTPLKPKHSTDDALSVRCVYDIVREFDKCENPTPQPTPPPTPSECSLSVTVQPSTTSAKSITGTVTGTLQNIAQATVSVTSYTVLNAVEPVPVDPAQTYPLAVNQQDGTFSWTYAPEGMGDQLQAITGYVTVIGNTATCGDEKEFNTAPQVEPVCPTIGDVQFLGDQGYYFKVNDLDFEKISDITIEYTAVFTDIDDPEHIATITGTDYYDGGNGTIYYDSDQEYPFGWFFSSDEMPQFQFDLPTIYTTLTIVYDGQICEGSVSEYIEVQEPDFIDCPGLSQIITNPNYGYETTITQYDENAGVFRIEYHVSLDGEDDVEIVTEANDNLTFDPDLANGSMNISGQLPSDFSGQFDKVITSIEVFLVYTPSDLYSDQCDDDEVYATLYTAQVDDGCPRIGTLASDAPYKLTINVDNYNGNRIESINLYGTIYGADNEVLGTVQENSLPVHLFTNGTYTWYVSQSDIQGLTLDYVTSVVGTVQLVPKTSTGCNTQDPKQFDTFDLQN